jgi:hypothetical protein
MYFLDEAFLFKAKTIMPMMHATTMTAIGITMDRMRNVGDSSSSDS